MARVRNIHSGELPPDLTAIYEEFAGSYGPFGNQVAVFAHVPAALRHLMPLLMELRTAKTLPKQALIGFSTIAIIPNSARSTSSLSNMRSRCGSIPTVFVTNYSPACGGISRR